MGCSCRSRAQDQGRQQALFWRWWRACSWGSRQYNVKRPNHPLLIRWPARWVQRNPLRPWRDAPAQIHQTPSRRNGPVPLSNHLCQGGRGRCSANCGATLFQRAYEKVPDQRCRFQWNHLARWARYFQGDRGGGPFQTQDGCRILQHQRGNSGECQSC